MRRRHRWGISSHSTRLINASDDDGEVSNQQDMGCRHGGNQCGTIVKTQADMSLAMVTIITPAFNSARFIRAAIDSVRVQTYQNWEMLVVDDCSCDETCAIVEDMVSRDERIRLIRLLENVGPAAARNAAIAVSKGRYLSFLDSDDIWLPEKLERQLAFMNTTACALSFTAYERINEDGRRSSGIVEVPPIVDYERLLTTNVIGCLTAVYDTEVIGKVYTPLIRKREDYALWLKILKMGYEACGLNECLAMRRIRSDSDSANKLEAALYQWQMYRDYENLPFFKRLYCFANYAYHGYRKRRIK